MHQELQNNLKTKERIIIQDNNTNISEKRNLQNLNPEPMRVTFDTSYFDTISENQQHLRQYIDKLIETSQTWLHNNLKVIRNNYGLQYQQSYGNCHDYTPQNNNNINNTDLHIYVMYFNQETSVLANAIACGIYFSNGRPAFGRISFNLHFMEDLDVNNNDEFENQFEIIIHEITHILGFNGYDIQFYKSKETGLRYQNPTQKQTIRGHETTWLTTPKVKLVAQQHFGCVNAIGAQLENQGSQGSIGSHWERTLLQDEYMTASAVTVSTIFSKFTLALLDDTGWYYPDYSNAGQLVWGYQKGCEFMTSCDKDKFSEFVELETLDCTFDRMGWGTTFGDYYLDDQCAYISPYSNRHCYQSTQHDQENYNYTGNYFGYMGKCFNSNVFHINYINDRENNIRCHKYECVDNVVNIEINSELYPCQNGQAQITVKGQNQSLAGTVQCPDNEQFFCQEYPIMCKDQCNQNGYCQNNLCFCNQNYTGETCDINCQNGQYLQEDQCFNECSEGYTLRLNDKVCVKNCDKKCDGCKGEICIKCSSNTRDIQNNCSCINGYQEFDPMLINCDLICNYPCLTCQDIADNCLSCQTQANRISDTNCQCDYGYYDDQTQCQQCDSSNPNEYCQQQCNYKCKTCQNNNINTCIECFDDTRDFDNNCDCIQSHYQIQSHRSCTKRTCNHPCQLCNAQLECLTCKQQSYRSSQPPCKCIEKYYENSDNICVLCKYPCLTCFSEQNCKSCQSPTNRQNSDNNCICNTGYFDNNSSCQQCNLQCLTCENTSSNCIQCRQGLNRKMITPNCECNNNSISVDKQIDCQIIQDQLCTIVSVNIGFINSQYKSRTQ